MQSSGGLCSDPAFAPGSGEFAISGAGDSVTIVVTDDETGASETYIAPLDTQACRVIIDRSVASVLPLDDGSSAEMTIASRGTIVIQGTSASLTESGTLSADVPVQGLPCTFVWTGSGTRVSSQAQPSPQPESKPDPDPLPPQQPPTPQPPPQRRPMADGIWHVRYGFFAAGGACGDDFRRFFEHDVEPRLTGYDDCSRRHAERRVPGGWELVVVDECPFTDGTLTLFQEDGASVATGTLLLVEYGDTDRTPAATCILEYNVTATRP